MAHRDRNPLADGIANQLLAVENLGGHGEQPDHTRAQDAMVLARIGAPDVGGILGSGPLRVEIGTLDVRAQKSGPPSADLYDLGHVSQGSDDRRPGLARGRGQEGGHTVPGIETGHLAQCLGGSIHGIVAQRTVSVEVDQSRSQNRAVEVDPSGPQHRGRLATTDPGNDAASNDSPPLLIETVPTTHGGVVEQSGLALSHG